LKKFFSQIVFEIIFINKNDFIYKLINKKKIEEKYSEKVGVLVSFLGA
jgi:hypothetical protein